MSELLFSQSLNLGLEDLRVAGKLINFMREVNSQASLAYMVSRKEGAPVEMQLMGFSPWQALLAGLNPSLSLPLSINMLELEVKPAAARIDEIYRIVTGDIEFAGSDENAPSISSSGLEKKLREFGTVIQSVTEVQTSAGGGVTVNYPISDITAVAAFKPGNIALTVQPIVSPNLGIVPLNDGVSPIADGIAVSITYNVVRYSIYKLSESLQQTSQVEQVDAVLASQVLLSYIAANT